MHSYRTHTCGELRREHVGQTVRLSGWVHRKRDHGQLLFIDVRDHHGITQVVFQPEQPFFGEAEGVRLESVITATGEVVARTPDTVNPNLATGEVELVASAFTLDAQADVLPLQVNAEREYPEETRLRYRFLDLRRETMQRNILLRSRVISSIRRRMEAQGFVEFQTPILTASSPEGARDFLVPSRLHPGEFYQLDLEMAFVEQEDVFQAVEPVMHGVFTEFSDWQVTPLPFPRIPYREAVLRYGTDKPDLRNPIEIADVTEVFADGGFAVFARAIEQGARVRALPAPGAIGRPRRFFDQMVEYAQSLGAPGLGYVQYGEGEPKGPVAKFLDSDRLARLKQEAGLAEGDAVFFVCAERGEAERLSGLIRTRLGEELGLIEQGVYRFCWVVDFPMFEWDEAEKQVIFSHNPFSMPQGGLEALETKDPLEILAHQYDIVCNGVELSSGAIRNHRPDIMVKAFETAGYGREVLEARFGGMFRALHFGAPPHGGIAPGIDRIVMLLAKVPNLREVTAFPLNQQAQELLLGAPSPVDDKQLKELHLQLSLVARERLREEQERHGAMSAADVSTGVAHP